MQQVNDLRMHRSEVVKVTIQKAESLWIYNSRVYACILRTVVLFGLQRSKSSKGDLHKVTKSSGKENVHANKPKNT